jgi:Phospholipase_D-nuclease N-terminal
MLRFDIIFFVVELALLIFCLVDVISIYESRIKVLNKITWVFIIILLPVLGPILWLVIGKDRSANRPAERARDARPLAPDDDPEFLRRAEAHESQEARIRRLEAELKALNDDKPDE